jgi:hypothetical protein
MLQALVLAAVAAAVWRIGMPGRAFLRGFASLLDAPEHGRAGLLGWVTLTRFVGGEHDGRAVTLVFSPRRRHQLGYVVLGTATTAARPWSGSERTSGAAVSTPRMREALDVLIGRHGLTLELADGWLKATWIPMGLFIFPGRFDPEKWREILAHMHALACELERREHAGAAPGFIPAATSPPG